MNFHRTLVVSPICYAEPPQGVAWMLESAARHGIAVTSPRYTAFTSLRAAKIDALFPFVMERLDRYDFVLLVDACDILFAAGLEEIHARFADHGAPFLMSAEANCWPERNRAKTPGRGRFRFLNSGFYMATREAFSQQTANLMAWIDRHPDPPTCDQTCWYDAWLGGAVDLALDYDCRLCQSMFLTTADEFDWGRRPQNRAHGSRPCVFHGNGRYDMARLREALVGFGPTPPRPSQRSPRALRAQRQSQLARR